MVWTAVQQDGEAADDDGVDAICFGDVCHEPSVDVQDCVEGFDEQNSIGFRHSRGLSSCVLMVGGCCLKPSQ